jgi:hypothetical protein
MHRVGRSKFDEYLHKNYQLTGQLQPRCHSLMVIQKPRPKSIDHCAIISVNKTLAAEEIEVHKQQIVAKDKKVMRSHSNYWNSKKMIKRRIIKLFSVIKRQKAQKITVQFTLLQNQM